MDHQKLIQDDRDSYGSTDSMEEPPILNIEDLSKNVEKIQMNCRFLDKASNTIGTTTKDTKELRRKMWVLSTYYVVKYFCLYSNSYEYLCFSSILQTVYVVRV